MVTFEVGYMLLLSQGCSSLAVEVLQKSMNKTSSFFTRVALLGGSGAFMK